MFLSAVHTENPADRLIGSVVGIFFGSALPLIMAALGYWNIAISWPAIALAVAFSVGLGIGFGSYPAYRAAQLDPITALHAE